MKRTDKATTICGYCAHLSTKAATDDSHTPEETAKAVEEAAKLAAAGVGRCVMLSTDRGQIFAAWDTVCIHFEPARNVEQRRHFVEKHAGRAAA